jgi:putative peptide zinc metalloprotease protein
VSSAPRRSTLVSAAPLEKGVVALAARHGTATEQPALRSSLVIRRVVQMGEVNWVVKNPETTKYYCFDEGSWALIELFDGTRTPAEVLAEYQRRYPSAEIDLPLVLDYVENFQKMEFLEQSVKEGSLRQLEKLKTARQRAAEEKAEGFDIFMIPFKVFDPNRFMNRTIKYVRWIWRPATVAVAFILFALTTSVIVQHWGLIWGETLALYAFLRKPFWDIVEFFAILTCVGAIHELAHGYVCKFYGGDVHDIGVALLYFMPAFYCDTTDALLFQNKWQRLWVTLAGIYIEALICVIATGLWVASYPDTLLHDVAFKAMLFTGVGTVFFNINPLRKVDGYLALTSVVEIPELREDSYDYLAAIFKRYVLRLNVEVPVLSRRKRRIFLIYGPLALAFTVVIMLFIGHLFYNFYAKYFPNLAIVLLALTLLRLFRKQVRLFLRSVKLFYLDKKEWLMSRRARTFLLGCGAALLAFLAIPFSRRTLRTEIVLMPVREVHLEAPEDGIIREVLVREGDSVREGQIVALVESPAVTSAIAGLTAQREGMEKEMSRRRADSDSRGVFESESRGTAIAASLRSEENRRNRLAIRSPISGRLLTPRLQDLTGHFVRAASPIADVGDCRELKAEIPVSERLLTFLQPGSPVSVQLRARSARFLRGSIVSISPATLSAQHRADVGREVMRPSERPERFVAIARFENADGDALPGMTGKAKVYMARASYLSRTWRLLSDWLQQIFW